MISLLMLAAIAAPGAAVGIREAAPQLLNKDTILRVTDYPEQAYRQGESGIVSILLKVSPDGKATSCAVSERSGSDILDVTTCALFKSRGRFTPARDATGAAVAGEYRTAAIWFLPGQRVRRPSDTVLTTRFEIPLYVARVPDDYRSAIEARLIFDAAGRITACEVTKTSGSAAADRAACAYVRPRLALTPPRSEAADVPAAAVRYLVASLLPQAADTSVTK